MDKREVILFFDALAESWDKNTIRNQSIIDKILDVAGVTEEKTVLDIACGTGVLIPDYLNRKAKKCVAVDISENMIEIAKSKFSEHKNIEFLCSDAESLDFFNEFDCAVIYNAFPHFVNTEPLFESVAKALRKGGRITVAHGMSRAALLKHHSGSAKNVSRILPEAEETAELMKPYFEVDTVISNDELYIVSAKVRK